MRGLRWTVVIGIVVCLGFVAKADGVTDYFFHGLQSIYYYSIRIDERFANLQPTEAAMREFDQAIRQGGDDAAEARLMLGLLHQMLNEPAEALVHYRALKDELPEEAWTYVLIADLLFEERSFEEAKQYYRMANEQGEFARARLGLGRLAKVEGRTESAVSYLEQAIELAPDFVDAYIALGLLHYQEGHHDVAIERLEEANRHNPRVAMVHYYLGKLYQEQGDDEKALHALDRATQLETR